MAPLPPLPPIWFWTNDADQTEFGQEHMPTLQELVDFLRSEKPLPRQGRLWLADLLDPNATNTPKRLKIEGRKPGPKRETKRYRNRWIYERLDGLVRGQGHPVKIAPMKLEAAIALVAEEMSWIDAKNPEKKRKPSRASLMEIWRKMRAEAEAMEQAALEADEG